MDRYPSPTKVQHRLFSEPFFLTKTDFYKQINPISNTIMSKRPRDVITCTDDGEIQITIAGKDIKFSCIHDWDTYAETCTFNPEDVVGWIVITSNYGEQHFKCSLDELEVLEQELKMFK